MIVEIALLTAKPGLQHQVRDGLRAARPVIARMPGYVDSVFHQGLEEPESFILRIDVGDAGGLHRELPPE